MPISPTDHKVWSYQDYLNEEEGEIYEIIEGDLLMTPPSPNIKHQFISRNLEFLIFQYVKENDLGEVAYAPVDVVLDDKNVVQPDILFISKSNTEIIKENAVFGSPDVVIEILSPSSIQRDRYEKKKLYEHFRIKEYWIIDPPNCSIEVLVLEDDRYELYSFASHEGVVKSLVIEGFEVELSDILE